MVVCVVFMMVFQPICSSACISHAVILAGHAFVRRLSSIVKSEFLKAAAAALNALLLERIWYGVYIHHVNNALKIPFFAVRG